MNTAMNTAMNAAMDTPMNTGTDAGTGTNTSADTNTEMNAEMNADTNTDTNASSPSSQDGKAAGQQDRQAVLETVAGMLDAILGSDIPDGTGIGMETRFADDLELESVDFVALTGRLTERYEDRVNFVAFLSGLELEEIIQLTVGQLVDYIVTCLHAPHSAVRS